MPKLSIITVNLNNAKGLEKTIESVFQQTNQNFEYIIIDGCSSDGSKEIIHNNSFRLGYWISEKDKGIYSAMNKGISNSQGEYLLFLNSGDLFNSDVILDEMYPHLDGTNIIYGNILLVQSKSKSWIGNYPKSLSLEHFINSSLPHASTFIKRSLFTKIGLYDEDLVICSDWKFFMDAICLHKVTYKHVDKVISNFYLNGISSIEGSDAIIRQEKQKVITQEYPEFLTLYFQLSMAPKAPKGIVDELADGLRFLLRKIEK